MVLSDEITAGLERWKKRHRDALAFLQTEGLGEHLQRRWGVLNVPYARVVTIPHFGARGRAKNTCLSLNVQIVVGYKEEPMKVQGAASVITDIFADDHQADGGTFGEVPARPFVHEDRILSLNSKMLLHLGKMVRQPELVPPLLASDLGDLVEMPPKKVPASARQLRAAKLVGNATADGHIYGQHFLGFRVSQLLTHKEVYMRLTAQYLDILSFIMEGGHR